MDSPALDFDFQMAMQPIVNVATRQIFAHEALVRGPSGDSAAPVLAKVHDGNLYRFDQACRTRAIETASRLEIPAAISINIMPNAVYKPELCLRTTLQAAQRCQFPLERIIFEINEAERVQDMSHLRDIVEHYRERGFKVAIDDFGAGYAGLNFLAEFDTDIIKLDMALIRHIDRDPKRQIIVRGITDICRELDVDVVAEGVEDVDEFRALADFGVELFQGYFFARPQTDSLPEIHLPA
ncbi:EAL domain-containing protein [Oleiagrimonas sp. C23AA]|uniref:EAL domain-containing protein n=1 Tax=Oleiagrimonas sp. C23AA TaxID=2719047 RepID=UPI001F0F5DD4|nr:EAL domain-containing protein [Oleiagrimonas sp. C23AA]